MSRVVFSLLSCVSLFTEVLAQSGMCHCLHYSSICNHTTANLNELEAARRCAFPLFYDCTTIACRWSRKSHHQCGHQLQFTGHVDAFQHRRETKSFCRPENSNSKLSNKMLILDLASQQERPQSTEGDRDSQSKAMKMTSGSSSMCKLATAGGQFVIFPYKSRSAQYKTPMANLHRTCGKEGDRESQSKSRWRRPFSRR